MMKVTAVSAVGTLAYIIEEEALLVRVNNGWQYIAVSVKNFKLLMPVLKDLPFKTLFTVKFYATSDDRTSAHNSKPTTTPTFRS